MNKNFKILGAVMLGFMSFSCNNNQGNNSSEATTPVWVEDVQLRNIEEYITTTGTAKAAKTIEIKSETNGAYYLQKNPKTGRPYQLGDIVEAGAVIIRLENKEYENNVQLESKKLQIQITEKEWEGQKILLEKGGATEKDVNNAENLYQCEISFGKRLYHFRKTEYQSSVQRSYRQSSLLYSGGRSRFR
jgi:membrane fusion protein (multidrug efflux system)